MRLRRTADGFHGRVRTLRLDATLMLVPAEPSDAENASGSRVKLGGSGRRGVEPHRRARG